MLYKLTTQDWKTRAGQDNETHWGPGVTHRVLKDGELCTPGCLHAYTNPLLAVVMNSVHARIPDPVMWECVGDIIRRDNGLKVGCRELTTTRIIETPRISATQRRAFGILCALEVYGEATFGMWARAWLDNLDRSQETAIVELNRLNRYRFRNEGRAAVDAALAASCAVGRHDKAYVDGVSARTATWVAEVGVFPPVDFVGLINKAMEVT